MRQLTFLSCWPNGRQHAWSGTPEGLYRALSKRLSVQELDVSTPHSKTPFRRIHRIFDFLCCQLLSVRSAEQIINRSSRAQTSAPYFSFAEYLTKVTKQTYCYQDLSVDFLVHQRQRGLSDDFPAISPAMPSFSLKYKQKRANRFYRNCAGVFTMSQWLREDLVHRTGLPEEKVHHVGGGFSFDTAKIDSGKKEGFRFLFVGKDWDRKGGNLVVEAFQLLKSLCPDRHAQLYIAGPSQMPECIKDADDIVFLGLLPREDLVPYYNLCDYFVMPSKFEAYGLVFAEALCFGLPCIGRNRYAMPEFIQDGHNGYLIESNDPEELALAMKKLLVDGQAMAQTVQESRAHYIEKYSWDSVADRIVRIITQDGYRVDPAQ